MKHETFGTRSLEFILSTLALVAAVFRKMLKTWVTLGNISLVLSNLTKIYIYIYNICNVQRPLPLVNVHAVNIHIFSLVPQLRIISP